MTVFTTDLTLAPALRRLAAWEAQAPRALAGVVTRLGDAYLGALKDATPRGRGESTGRKRLVDSYTTERGDGGLTYRITNRAPQLRYVRRGRGPVTAIGARALRFVIDGRVFYRRRVKAAKANDFPATVRRQMQPQIRAAQQAAQALGARLWVEGR